MESFDGRVEWYRESYCDRGHVGRGPYHGVHSSKGAGAHRRTAKCLPLKVEVQESEVRGVSGLTVIEGLNLIK